MTTNIVQLRDKQKPIHGQHKLTREEGKKQQQGKQDKIYITEMSRSKKINNKILWPVTNQLQNRALAESIGKTENRAEAGG